MDTKTILTGTIAALFTYLGADMLVNTVMHTRGAVFLAIGVLMFVVMIWGSKEGL